MSKLRGLIVLGLAFALCFLLVGNVCADQVLHKIEIEWRDADPPEIEFIIHVGQGHPPGDTMIFENGGYELNFKDLPEFSKGTWLVWVDLEGNLSWIIIKRSD